MSESDSPAEPGFARREPQATRGNIGSTATAAGSDAIGPAESDLKEGVHGGTRGSPVCLSFDWDGVSVWMAGGATDARSLSRGEFGPRVGIPRLLSLCERLGITATFFTPGHTADTFPETAAAIAAAGHELAAHGYAHEDFEPLSLNQARDVVRRAADAIERACGRRPRGMRFPPWAVAGEHFEILFEEGYTYSSSVMDDVRPHWARGPGVV